jgi:2-methylisocitrate lyase-like PEP mutase family enzyme
MVEQGDTPVLPPIELESLGFKIAAYPLTLLSAATRAMEEALDALKAGQSPDNLSTFTHLREVAGFDDYFKAEKKYADK